MENDKETSFAVIDARRLTLDNERYKGILSSPIHKRRNSLDRKPLKRTLKNYDRDPEV